MPENAKIDDPPFRAILREPEDSLTQPDSRQDFAHDHQMGTHINVSHGADYGVTTASFAALPV